MDDGTRGIGVMQHVVLETAASWDLDIDEPN
jgi:hypothetical protein